MNVVTTSGKTLKLYDTLFSAIHSMTATTSVGSNLSVTFNTGATITGPIDSIQEHTCNLIHTIILICIITPAIAYGGKSTLKSSCNALMTSIALC